MAAHRKPSNVLQLAGAWKHDPTRRRVDPPTHKAIGRPPKPESLTFEQAWKYIVKCAPRDVLRDDRDRLWIEVAAHLLVQFRADPAAMHPAKLSRLTMMLAALGMSPADASRVAASPTTRAHNPFDD